MPPTPITLNHEDWQQTVSSAVCSIHTCTRPEVQSAIEQHHFRDGFSLMRQSFTSHAPVWHPPFADTGYIGLCFAFSNADSDSLALKHLYHRQMNITSGYAFDGAINYATGQPQHYIALQFSPDYLDSLAEQATLPNWLQRLRRERGIIERITVPQRLRERAWHMLKQPPAVQLTSRLRMESAALDWLADCLELRLSSSKHDPRIDDVIDIIHNEYDQHLTIAKLAQRCGINTCDLKAGFKRRTGHTINTYLTRTRLQAAELLLGERPDLSINIVAALCGYQPGHFSATFKKHHGVTPQQWRQNAR
ncbi:AraC family transcriptional regulator [Cardiobacteriaceae bacterium TAE3-ERU3]|nr:AraC family transcriptional regulator [Cardiobacteriaceae bacterium TAE3-ERU3]